MHSFTRQMYPLFIDLGSIFWVLIIKNHRSVYNSSNAKFVFICLGLKFWLHKIFSLIRLLCASFLSGVVTFCVDHAISLQYIQNTVPLVQWSSWSLPVMRDLGSIPRGVLMWNRESPISVVSLQFPHVCCFCLFKRKVRTALPPYQKSLLVPKMATRLSIHRQKILQISAISGELYILCSLVSRKVLKLFNMWGK